MEGPAGWPVVLRGRSAGGGRKPPQAASVKSRGGERCGSFCPAVSDDAAKAIRQQIKRWRLNLRSGQTLTDLAREINPIVRGWINYYGHFYRSLVIQSLRRIDDYLVRWAMRKYKRLRGKPSRAWELLHAVQRRQPQLFAHWTSPPPHAG